MAVDRPFFIAGVTSAIGGQMVPVPGGVLIKNSQGEIVGAVGVSGDNSDNDEAAAAGGIEASGFISDTGA
jgi:uncharacterized protein GlcG (DUF336 family)